jgi:hypothetical protein
MKCPICQSESIIIKRENFDNSSKFRRRCKNNHTFGTIETIDTGKFIPGKETEISELKTKYNELEKKYLELKEKNRLTQLAFSRYKANIAYRRKKGLPPIDLPSENPAIDYTKMAQAFHNLQNQGKL